ncbi:MAG: hypothetical protein LBN27_12185 [Prevotellaceae bacterium]|jgi:hypothetical protein|nr:hypothetical protein [Prevotellaceae bacterium]
MKAFEEIKQAIIENGSNPNFFVDKKVRLIAVDTFNQYVELSFDYYTEESTVKYKRIGEGEFDAVFAESVLLESFDAFYEENEEVLHQVAEFVYQYFNEEEQ